jgi:hypothetical protein
LNEEIDSIERNATWDLVYFSKDKDCVFVKWTYKRKISEKVKVERYKERLVTKRFSQ